jgi:exonuclease SbcC
MKKERRRINAQLQDVEVFADNSIEIDLITKLTEAETLLFAKMREKYEHCADFDPYTVLDVRVDAFTKRVEESRAKIAEIEDQMRNNRIMHKRYAFWERGFSRQGIPAYLLDGAVPILNEAVHELANILTDNELIITFDSAATKGTQDVFGVSVDYVDGGDDYDTTSRGEHTRVDLAVLFAIRELLASRGRQQCTQLFIDEVFDGLDEAGAEAVILMLRTFHADKASFVITHDPAMKNLADSVITVDKSDGYSRLCA